VPLGRHLWVGDLEHDHAADDDGAAGIHSVSTPSKPLTSQESE
jgi:hypothetical protein